MTKKTIKPHTQSHLLTIAGLSLPELEPSTATMVVVIFEAS